MSDHIGTRAVTGDLDDPEQVAEMVRRFYCRQIVGEDLDRCVSTSTLDPHA